MQSRETTIGVVASSSSHHGRRGFDADVYSDQNPPPPPAVPPPFTSSHPEHHYHRYDDDEEAPPDLSSRFHSIVLLEVSYVEPEYLRPWQKSRQGSCSGTGFAIAEYDEDGGDGDGDGDDGDDDGVDVECGGSDEPEPEPANDGDEREEVGTKTDDAAVAEEEATTPEEAATVASSPTTSENAKAAAAPEKSSQSGRRLRPQPRRRRGRILTNMHVVQDATDIRVRKHGNARRWRAEIVASGPDVDLAVLEIVPSVDVNDDDDDEGGNNGREKEDIDAFWDGVDTIKWATNGPPLLQSSVSVVGYPTGGRTICVTEGVVSRVDCRNYRLKTAGAAPGNVLVIQIDAAINAGNSGGPTFDDDGRVVGVAFQGLEGSDAQNVGYIIPADVALNFLHAIDGAMGEWKKEYQPHVVTGGAGGGSGENGRHRRYDGVQELPFRWAPLQNKSLRKLLRIPREGSGVVVTRVSPLARALHGGKDGSEFLLEDDVITKIDGRPIGDDYTVSLRGDELMNADFLITGKRAGLPTTFDVVRDTKEVKIEAVLGPLLSNVPREHGIDCMPDWLVLGGLLFVPLTCPLLTYGTEEDLEASGYLKIYDFICEQLTSFRTEVGREVILLIDILACDTNFGYDFRQSWRILESVNGEPVKNMAHLYNLYLSACESVASSSNGGAKGKAKASTDGDKDGGNERTEFLVFRFKNKSRIVLETADCVSSEAAVLEQHGIPAAVSPGVKARATAERQARDAMAAKATEEPVQKTEKEEGEAVAATTGAAP